MTPDIRDFLPSGNITMVGNITSESPGTAWVIIARFAIEGVTQGIVGLFGLLGNFLSILILYQRDMDLKPMFRQILITLISFDIFCIIFNLLLFCLPQLSSGFMDYVFPYIVPYALPLAQIALTGSIYSTLAVAIERYVSVCHPLYSPSHCSGNVAITTLILFSLLFNVCRFLEFTTTYDSKLIEYMDLDTNQTFFINETRAVASSTALRRNPLYSQVTMFIMLIVSGIIPLSVLIALNTRIYIAIRTRQARLATMTTRQKRDLAVAAVLVGIILVFIVCHSFKFFVNIYEAYIMHFGMNMEEAWDAWLNAIVSFSHLLSTVNSSINFVIYCYKDDKFREIFMKMLRSSSSRRRSMETRVCRNPQTVQRKRGVTEI